MLRCHAETRADRGAGLLGTITGFFVFLLLLFASVQVLYNLYATSVVTTAAFDAARAVAAYGNHEARCAATSEGEAVFRESVGRYAEVAEVELNWVCADPETVELEVVADHPSILPEFLRGLTGLGHLERTIQIRVEDHR